MTWVCTATSSQNEGRASAAAVDDVPTSKGWNTGHDEGRSSEAVMHHRDASYRRVTGRDGKRQRPEQMGGFQGLESYRCSVCRTPPQAESCGFESRFSLHRKSLNFQGFFFSNRLGERPADIRPDVERALVIVVEMDLPGNSGHVEAVGEALGRGGGLGAVAEGGVERGRRAAS